MIDYPDSPPFLPLALSLLTTPYLHLYPYNLRLLASYGVLQFSPHLTPPLTHLPPPVQPIKQRAPLSSFRFYLSTSLLSPLPELFLRYTQFSCLPSTSLSNQTIALYKLPFPSSSRSSCLSI